MSYQTFFDGTIDHVQTELLPEYQGKGKKPLLIDVAKFKEQKQIREENQKLLELGQIKMIEE